LIKGGKFLALVLLFWKACACCFWIWMFLTLVSTTKFSYFLSQ
jgi:hypothetical protein